MAPAPVDVAGDEQRPRLALRDVHRGWRGHSVLRGAGLTLAPGSVHWLGGPNGAGKTTLLRVAAGLITPESGSVELDGLHPDRDRRAFQAKLGFLPAGDRGMYARLTVRQNLTYWAGLAMVPRRRTAAAIEAALQRFGLSELARRRVDRLSMGQRQRVRLSMTFLHDPLVVLLDEPHTSLDAEGLALVDSAMAALADAGGAALWCSPALEHGQLRADARWLVHDGRVVTG